MDKEIKSKAIVTVAVVAVVIVILAAIIGITALILMLAANVVLEYFDKKTLTYPVSVAIVILLSIVGNFIRATVNKEK